MNESAPDAAVYPSKMNSREPTSKYINMLNMLKARNN
jgi:hypothetical protein